MDETALIAARAAWRRRAQAAQATVDLMKPVVEAARAWHANGVDPDGRFAKRLSDEVEFYERETQRFEGLA